MEKLQVLFSLYFNYLVSVTAGGPVSPRGHMKPSSTVDFDWFVVFESIKIFRMKLTEIVILWVYYTVPFGFSLFWHSRVNIFYFWNHFIWRRITDEGLLPEMRIWSILLIISDLKWCLHLSRSLLIFQLLGECHCWWTSESPRAHVGKFYGRLRLIRSVWEHQNFPYEIDWNCNFVGLLHRPFWL